MTGVIIISKTTDHAHMVVMLIKVSDQFNTSHFYQYRDSKHNPSLEYSQNLTTKF